MMDAGRDSSLVLADGRTVEVWDGGDPQGRAVLLHPGSPSTRVMGREGHEAALAHGVRLVSLSRPGYGGSTLPPGAPSLRATGADTAELARMLGLEEYAVLGASGGGPFAVATAIADPERVRAVGLAAGTGPWRLLAEPTEDDAQERALLALLDAGDVDGAWAGYRTLIADQLGGLAALDDHARVDAFFAGSPISPDDYGTRPVWTANLREVSARLDGLAFDNLAWGGTWDVDPRDVTAPVYLWYGAEDVMVPSTHGRWYAERLPRAELTVHPGENHADVCSTHWAEQLRALLD